MSRILFALNAPNGGATLSAINAIAELRKRGHQCYAVVPPSKHTYELNLLRASCEEVAEIYLPWGNRRYQMLWWKRPIQFIRDAFRTKCHLGTINALCQTYRNWKIDIVHTNTSVTIHPALAARKCGIPHVWHIRELIGSRDLFRFWLPEPALARRFVELSHAVIANSEQTRNFFSRNGLNKCVDVIYNGLALNEFLYCDRQPDLRASWGMSSEDLVIGMVANLSSRSKRHETFVRAAAKVCSMESCARFVVIGTDPTIDGGCRAGLAYAKNLKRLACELALCNGQLVWAGMESNVPAVMNSLDIVVHPAGNESFGRVGVEAMASGRPIIAAKEGGLGEVVLNNVTGFCVSQDDVEGFANAILVLIRDPELRKNFGAAGRERAIAMFSVEQMVDKLERIYERVQRSAKLAQ